MNVAVFEHSARHGQPTPSSLHPISCTEPSRLSPEAMEARTAEAQPPVSMRRWPGKVWRNAMSCPHYSGVDRAGRTIGRKLFESINRHGQVQAGRFSGIDVPHVVKKVALRDRPDATAYTDNSLRAGHPAAAAIAVESEPLAMKQTEHWSIQRPDQRFGYEAFDLRLVITACPSHKLTSSAKARICGRLPLD
jgi:hypothetical protein